MHVARRRSRAVHAGRAAPDAAALDAARHVRRARDRGRAGVVRVAREEAEVYFHSRPRASQLAAWASPQSTAIAGRAVIEESFRVVEKKYEGREVPLPPQWGGYRLVPESVEFWQGRRSRLHDRLRYRREPGGEWVVERLAP